jgi:hypothetical protein
MATKAMYSNWASSTKDMDIANVATKQKGEKGGRMRVMKNSKVVSVSVIAWH